jgi:hypothetical protein
MEPKKNDSSNNSPVESIKHKSTERRHLSQKKSPLDEHYPIKSDKHDEISMRIIDEGRSIANKEETQFIELVLDSNSNEKIQARKIKISCDYTHNSEPD